MEQLPNLAILTFFYGVSAAAEGWERRDGFAAAAAEQRLWHTGYCHNGMSVKDKELTYNYSLLEM